MADSCVCTYCKGLQTLSGYSDVMKRIEDDICYVCHGTGMMPAYKKKHTLLDLERFKNAIKMAIESAEKTFKGVKK